MGDCVMTYTNPRIENIRELMPVWTDLQKQTEKGALSEAFINANPRVQLILEHSQFKGKSFTDIAERLIEERLQMCFELIARQEALADAGAARARLLNHMYGLYVHEVLGGNVRAAHADIHQQALDVSIMYVLSHSQMMFARKFGSPDDPRMKRYEGMVEFQERQLRAFKKEGLDNPEKLNPEMPETFSPKQRGFLLQAYEDATLDVANANIALCEQTGKMVELEARTLHYWHQSLDENAIPGVNLKPVDDLQYESDLHKLYLERCQILLDRGGMIYDLSEKVAALTLY